ncbi:hypothetical protein ACFL0V_03250 [Nanoarchaeota archaeon]
MNPVQQAYQECINGRTDPYDAAQRIDQGIGGLTRVQYAADKNFRVYNGDQHYRLQHRGLNRKQQKRLQKLVVLLHQQVVENGGQGSVHLAQGRRVMSTKHHRGELKAYQQGVLQRYA